MASLSKQNPLSQSSTSYKWICHFTSIFCHRSRSDLRKNTESMNVSISIAKHHCARYPHHHIGLRHRMDKTTILCWKTTIDPIRLFSDIMDTSYSKYHISQWFSSRNLRMINTMVYFTVFDTYSAIPLEFVVRYQSIKTLIIITHIGVRHRMDKELPSSALMTTKRNIFRVICNWFLWKGFHYWHAVSACDIHGHSALEKSQ